MRVRFQVELEFVQCLANPHYLNCKIMSALFLMLVDCHQSLEIRGSHVDGQNKRKLMTNLLFMSTNMVAMT